MGDYRDQKQIDAWRTSGEVFQDAYGTHIQKTIHGTSLNGQPSQRYFLGADFSSTETMSFVLLRGSSFLVQLLGVPAGLHEFHPVVYPANTVGTSLTVMVDSTDGTVSLIAYYV